MTEATRPWHEMGWMHGQWEGDWLVMRQGQRTIRVKPAPGTVIESTRAKQGSTARIVIGAEGKPRPS